MDKDYTWYVALLKYCKDYYERFGEVPRSFPYKRKVYRKAEFINYIPFDVIVVVVLPFVISVL